MMRAPLLLALSIGIVACTEALPAGEQRPIVAALRTHDGKISILGGSGELRVVVSNDDGTRVTEHATLDELRRKDPETWQLVTSALAREDGAYVDATYTPAPAPKPL